MDTVCLLGDLNVFKDICLYKCELDSLLACALIETVYAHTHINVYLLCFNAMVTKFG